MNFIDPKSGYEFKDLFDPEKLKILTEDFFEHFLRKDEKNYKDFINYRDTKGAGLSESQISEILINASVILNDFIIELFQLEEYRNKFIEEAENEKKVLELKNYFQKKINKKFKNETITSDEWESLNNFTEKIKPVKVSEDPTYDEEALTAEFIMELVETEKNYRWFYDGDKFAPDNFVIPDEIKSKSANLLNKINSDGLRSHITDKTDVSDSDLLKIILAKTEKWLFGKKIYDRKTDGWIIYSEPEKLDFSYLVKNEKPDKDMPELMKAPDKGIHHRDGFKLTDRRMNKRQIQNEVDYCIYCHGREKDSCSKGLYDKNGDVKLNPLNIELSGCPLNEKISEMHYVRKLGLPIASLALVVIDNPNLPGTGHRICNDCMKSCIYQTQEPVNIPEIETSVLTDVFKLPYGYEIYSLLTRWNPLNIKRPYSLPYNGKNILVVGMGPAGYTLSHYLLNEGFSVTGIDALKIEKVNPEYTGSKDSKGFIEFPKPVKYFNREIQKELDERVLQGFGGVSEYGITVRWDKNFLTAIYINLARREYFSLYDGVRFGGTITIEEAWDLGFDHIAIATGAGKPTVINIKNNLITGIKKASDFLMSLQLTGAAKKDNPANLQIQLPAIVIGGGLTAIDTATELLAYYPIQVMKVLDKYEKLSAEHGEDKFFEPFNDREKEIMKTFIEHGKLIREEYENAEKENRQPDILSLENQWGGVTIAYRKKLTDSPAYRLNHEEVIKALDEGIKFAENMNPVEAIGDEFGAVKELVFKRKDNPDLLTLEAKTVMVAAGTSPNIIYEKEFPGTFKLDENGYFFKPFRFSGNELIPAAKDEKGFFTSYNKNGKYISFYGDNHPDYAGNVVKAMASAKDGYEKIKDIFKKDISELKSDPESLSERRANFEKMTANMDDGFMATVKKVIRLTPTIVEVIVKAPFAVRKFKPGQFYRMQNYEVFSEKINDTVLTMEGLAMTGSLTDIEKGLLSMIVLEMGVSSRLVATLKEGERIVVMGPTGTPTHIPKNENVLLAGGGLGNAVLFSIAHALKENNNRVIYFAGYKNSEDIYKKREIEKYADQVVWSNDFGDKILPERDQDLWLEGNIVESMINYCNLDEKKLFDFKTINRIIAIGSDRMMKAVKDSRYTVLKEMFGEHIAIGSINSPMQCMMKEICAQCLQKHIDPETGEESFVFSCFNQDQLLDYVDFVNLNQRLMANSVLEKLSNMYLTYLFSQKEKTASLPSDLYST
ncbi:MAG TPA: FAD-dependent oxidoreductase [Ignavibacteria bacterium]|nr:FAD-dependent oxidoreductase [Ignavibacteria bacterium]